ncbi:MAG: type II toxin-antitoxin system Phd/YefM family antitoxin [Ilumatobacteraceae bacterium]
MARPTNQSKPADDPSTPSSSPNAAPPVGIRQLRADVAAYVRRAGAGEHLVINVGGRPMAQLGPLAAPDGLVRLDDLVARGAVVPPRRSGPWHMTAPIIVWSGNRLDRLLREIR